MRTTLGLALLATAFAAVAQAQTSVPIIRIEPDGPPGVGLTTGNGTSRSHVFYRSPDNERLRTAVWEGQPGTFGPNTIGYTEFVYVLDGSLTLIDGNGREDTFHPGEAVLIPRGTVHTWKQTERMREIYVIFDLPDSGADAATSGTPPTFIRLDPDGGDEGLVGEGRTKSRRYFAGPDRSSVGVWETAPHTGDGFSRTRYSELMVFLSGTTTLTQPDGTSETFRPGDAVLVPRGAEYKWSSDTVRKFWVIFDQDPVAVSATQ